jgi:hypothetical protein
MKEQELNVGKVQTKLTVTSPTDRLERIGDNFMTGPNPPEIPNGVGEPQSAPQQEQPNVEIDWEDVGRRLKAQGVPVPADLARAVEELRTEDAEIQEGRRVGRRLGMRYGDEGGEDDLSNEGGSRRGHMGNGEGRTNRLPEGAGRSAQLYLDPAELESLQHDPITWLNSKFDMIYDNVEDGQVLESQLMNQMQTMITVAMNHIALYADALEMTPAKIKEFTNTFNSRLNLIYARSLIEQKNTESIKGAVARLRSHGLFYALGMENGRVNTMYGRLGELLEDQRLAQTVLRQRAEEKGITDEEKQRRISQAQKLHVTPEMMHNLQEDLIAEQMHMLGTGIGPFVEDYRRLIAQAITPQQPGVEVMSEQAAQEFARKQIERQIRRTTRTAYDVFVVSQRQAVIVSRGHSLDGVEAFNSEPANFFNMFNLEDLLTKKFGMFNKSANAFLDNLKLEIARSKLGDKSKGMSDEDLLDYGTRMFRVFFGAPDFFSSGWRIVHFQEKIHDYLEHARADYKLHPENYSHEPGKDEDFGLFLRLKKGDPKRMAEDRRETWGKIAEIRPEEMLRLFRERAVENPALRNKLREFLSGSAFNKYRAEGARDEFEVYDKFKAEFGAITHLIRQKNYENFHALRIGTEGFTPEEIAQINTYVGNNQAAEQLKLMYAELSRVSGADDTIKTLLGDKFEDIYTRELLVDDVLLNIIDKQVDGVTPLSSVWQSEPSQDPLVRNFGDLLNMATAASELVKFIGTEETKTRLESAMKFAEAVSNYNGQGARAEAVRYTVGTFLEISEQDFFWDALGIGKLPFRKAMSEIERVYGPQAQPMSRDQVRHQLDGIHSALQAAVEKAETPEEKALVSENAEKYYHELEKLLKVRGSDMVKLRGLSLTFFLILAALAEGYFIVDIKGLTGKK